MDRKVEPLDDNPPIEHIRKMAESFNKTGITTDKFDWLNDKSKDFYLGMFAALRIAISGVNTLAASKNMTLSDLSVELMVFNGQIANKILDKSILEG